MSERDARKQIVGAEEKVVLAPATETAEVEAVAQDAPEAAAPATDAAPVQDGEAATAPAGPTKGIAAALKGNKKRKPGLVLHRRSSNQPRRTGIVREPAVAQRLEQLSSLEKITSNGTIAAAVMVVAALVAVGVANSPAYEVVLEILEAPVTLGVGVLTFTMSLEAFINDFLMAIFFMLVGIELKYEMTIGQLRRPRQAALPMLAAVSGVAVPALIYLAFNSSAAGGQPQGWAVPIATDIAFALGVMVFYGQTPNVTWLAATGVMLVILWGINRARVYSLKPYFFMFLLLWFCMYNSGVHATLAGVLLAFFLPARSDVRLSGLRDWLGRMARELDDRYDDEAHVLGQHDFTKTAVRVERVVHHVTPPLERAENNIAVFVNFFVLPLFAFANAQIRIVGADFGAILTNPVTQGVFFGAVIGKPIGIILVTFLLVKIRFAKLPRNVTWDQVIAVGIMGGLGFTMSILISGLAYSDSFDVLSAKCAILAASVAASVLGILFVQIYHGITNMSEEPDGELEAAEEG